MSPQLIGGGVLILLWLLGRKKPEPVVTEKVHSGAAGAEVGDGTFAAFKGDVDSGTYVRCEKVADDGAVTVVPDVECKAVLDEWPEIEVPITARIRMTEGRTI